MNPHEILIALWQVGILVKLTPNGESLAVPAGRLTSGQRELVLSNKPALIAFLLESRATTEALFTAAMRRCDEFNDGELARQEMCQQCLELPPHLQADLRDHFQRKPANLP